MGSLAWYTCQGNNSKPNKGPYIGEIEGVMPADRSPALAALRDRYHENGELRSIHTAASLHQASEPHQDLMRRSVSLTTRRYTSHLLGVSLLMKAPILRVPVLDCSTTRSLRSPEGSMQTYPSRCHIAQGSTAIPVNPNISPTSRTKPFKRTLQCKTNTTNHRKP